MATKIEEFISRLADINCANSLIQIDDELVNERKQIIDYLKSIKVIKT
jgi:hypothetical protein